MSIEDRERLKEEYKQHYRLLLEQKKKLAAYERKARIMKSLEAMDPSPVVNSFQQALKAVRDKITQAEARLETWMDDKSDSEPEVSAADEEVIQKHQAGQLVRQIRAEMGVIERDIEQKAASLSTGKTISSQTSGNEQKGQFEKGEAGPPGSEQDPARTNPSAPKTIGRKKT